ncbi:urea ABC transporter permease subunit UrtB [Gilvimarinus sp. DA14]|uniref:urea ABC transporter permease subunit UrtB n=1 Tax=Gilvimarinus sp. DA14 TaxID=2956798 RepID=UPI0020B8B198|nr:urea ABC transporter permease subunit UrtB [Gilvimarinus sp. DA14]UTF60228.1 urea ABC transporter permease subunit UrtB [Gilvimarinus sp. DA14]
MALLKKSMCLWIALGAFLLTLPSAYAQSPAEPDFPTLVDELASGSLSKRGKTVEAIAATNHERAQTVLKALLEGSLESTRSDPRQVIIETGPDTYVLAANGEAVSADSLGRTKRIPIHNKLRSQIKTLLAQINLSADDAATRLNAVEQMISDGVDNASIALLQQLKIDESSSDVRDAMTAAIALAQLDSSDNDTRLTAVKELRGSLYPEVRGSLQSIADNDAESSIRTEAQRSLDSIDGKLKMFRLGENIFFGLSLGSVLLLSAIGLAITFGVMGVINMAHGELMMIGAYTTWVIQQAFPNQIEYSLFMAIPAAFVVSGLVGIAIERGVIQFLYGRPLETLLATFGISLILQQAARSIFSPLNRAVSLPEWMSGSLQINPAFSITFNRLYILLFGLMVFFALLAVLKKTSLGLKVRAVSQNRPMARAVGVRASWVDAMTFGLGSGVAGIAGVALSQLTNVGPNLGQAYIIDSFMVVVFGGVGNLWGTLVSAMSLGVINKFMEPFAGAVLAKVLILVLLILFIQKKPKGLFPQKGRAAAD